MTKELTKVSFDCLTDNPYGQKIGNFITTLTGKCNVTDSREILNIMENAFYADSHIRFGPKPELENRFYLRSVIKNYMDEERPIPVLVPWGSVKTSFTENVDIAEFMAIKQIIHLNDRVKEVYKPGIEVNIRIEDTSGYSLFALDANRNFVIENSNNYIKNFIDLVSILDVNSCINPVRESNMIGSNNFDASVDLIRPLFESYLDVSDAMLNLDYPESKLRETSAFKAIQEIGWNGVVSKEQRNYYYNAYKKLYDNISPYQSRERLSLYLSQSIIRRKLKMTGIEDKWDCGFIQLTFVPPIPGVPEGYDKNYVYYRTIPENYTRLHASPWRSKGFLAISDKGTLSIKPKLSNWTDSNDYNRMELSLSSGTKTVKIQSDYILL